MDESTSEGASLWLNGPFCEEVRFISFRVRTLWLRFRLEYGAIEHIKHGGVAELADALDLGSSVLTDVQVQFLSPPLNTTRVLAS